MVDIDPAGRDSGVQAVWGESLAGYYSESFQHAAVWASPSAPPIDLHPAGYVTSCVLATNGRQHAGYAGKVQNGLFATLPIFWTGFSPAGVVLPIPSDADDGWVNAISANQQGGAYHRPSSNSFRAVLWSGERGSFVDLHPRDAKNSEIHAMTDTYQAGGVDGQAALWFGSPETLRIIGSPESHSGINAAAGPYQVGASNGRATLWGSTATSAFDLHALLPSRFASSGATCIWTERNKIIIGGSADDAETGLTHAIVWTYTPPAGTPTFTGSPKSISVAVTGSFVLTASATATSAISFRWQREGVDIAGATRATLLDTRPGLYTVVATTSAGSAKSSPAFVSQAGTNDIGRLANYSIRARLTVDAPLVIAGFVITGTTAKTVLIRAIGPGLSSLGVSGSLTDPKLQLFSGSTLLYENDDWAGDALLASIGASAGAFPIADASSKDAMLLVTLPPGSYTVQVSSEQNTTGTVLAEVYEVL
jgi:hypothetical protein